MPPGCPFPGFRSKNPAMNKIDVKIRNDLVAIAEGYASATNLSLSTVSRKFYGHRRFLENFGAGRSTITLSKLSEIVDKFDEAWPAAKRWPAVAILARPSGKSGGQNSPSRGR